MKPKKMADGGKRETEEVEEGEGEKCRLCLSGCRWEKRDGHFPFRPSPELLLAEAEFSSEK